MNGYPHATAQGTCVTGADGPSLFDFLQRDHDEARSMTARARAGDPIAYDSFADVVRRHDEAEAQTLYAWMNEVPSLASEAAEAMRRHDEIVRLFAARNPRAVDVAIAHFDHEDQIMFPEVIAMMPGSTQRRLGARYEEIYQGGREVESSQPSVFVPTPLSSPVYASGPALTQAFVESCARYSNPGPATLVPRGPAIPRQTRVQSLNPRPRRVSTAGDVLRQVAHRVLGLPAIIVWRRKRSPR